jgi:hypothetical protein
VLFPRIWAAGRNPRIRNSGVSSSRGLGTRAVSSHADSAARHFSGSGHRCAKVRLERLQSVNVRRNLGMRPERRTPVSAGHFMPLHILAFLAACPGFGTIVALGS